MPRALVRALVAWAFVAFAVWNGVFDGVIRQAEYAFIGRRAMHELGAGPEVAIDFAMVDGRRLAAREATLWAVFILAAGAGVSFYVYRAARRNPHEEADGERHA